MAHTPKPIRKALKRAQARSEPWMIVDEAWSIEPSTTARDWLKQSARDARRTRRSHSLEYDPKREWLNLAKQQGGHRVDLSVSSHGRSLLQHQADQ